MANGESVLTEEIRSLIGYTGEKVEATIYGIEKEGLRRFVQAVMDPDPRFWDEDFARSTKFGEIITPAIFCTYLSWKRPAGAEDPVEATFRRNPISDALSDIDPRLGPLPPVPTNLTRMLNAGNEIEVYQYPSLGDRIFSQGKYADIKERIGRDGSHMLIITTETRYTNQKGELLCITRSSSIRR